MFNMQTGKRHPYMHRPLTRPSSNGSHGLAITMYILQMQWNAMTRSQHSSVVNYSTVS